MCTCSCKSKDDEGMFDIGKYTSCVKLKLTWGLCVPDSCKSKDDEGMFDIGKYTSGVKLKLNWVCVCLIAVSLRMTRVCLI